MSRILCFLSLIFFGLAGCQDKPLPPLNSLEAYVGVWKVTDPQGKIYYMTLKEDGSGSTTRGEGEFGVWKINQNHIQTKWVPKNLTIQFSSGSAKVKIPTSKANSSQKFIAERVD